MNPTYERGEKFNSLLPGAAKPAKVHYPVLPFTDPDYLVPYVRQTWPEMQDPKASPTATAVYGPQRRDGNAHLAPHSHQGAPGPSEAHRVHSRMRDAAYRMMAKKALANRNAKNGTTSEQ